ncbi:LLM class flavin-dependent oxidoreductase [Cohnella fermenti]|uniref:LLM class flavin-dependent oxidoreductase n=2 Tax=Cohnella fermenti TaxID=2565925 RepID=A0A4S4BFU2_9BACL|nr:LLM class flavin-dependent oxidoreductase [Cohnella fermenti]
MLELGVLDQSVIGPGESATTALWQTVELARRTEKLGYSRFWVSEHHDSGSLAGSSPEVLLAAIGAHTSRIRIGSGGVLLPHYSPYKVAENFRVLEALFPGRVDLGIGRAPGGFPLSSLALRGPAAPVQDDGMPDKLRELGAYLETGQALPAEHPLHGLIASPRVASAPEIWLLGSSDVSAALASRLGARFSFAHFINGEGGQRAVAQYAASFRPGMLGTRAQASICVFVVCAETDERAEREAKAADLRLLYQEKGERHRPYPSVEEAEAYPYTEWERARTAINRRRMVVGGPERVRDSLQELADSYRASELLVVCPIADFRARVRCYELLAALFLRRSFG